MSPKQPSPLLDLVVGATRRTRVQKERQNTTGHMKAIFGPDFKLFYSTDDIQNTKHSIVQSRSRESPLEGLANFSCHLSRNSNSEIREGSVLSIFDKNNQRFVYNLVTKLTKTDKASYSTLNTCLVGLRKHVQNHNVQRVSIPQLECDKNGLDWPMVCKMIIDVFKNDKIEFPLHVGKGLSYQRNIEADAECSHN